MRFPRPCRFVARRVVLAYELRVCEPLPEHLAHAEFEAVGVVEFIAEHVLAIVESEHLFIEVAEKMVRLNRNIRSVQLAFYERPEIFERVRMHLAAHVFDRVIDYLMLKVLVESTVGLERIRIECGTSLHMLVHQVVNSPYLPSIDDFGANLTTALHESNDGSFILLHVSGKGLAAVLVHVPSLAADEGFVPPQLRFRFLRAWW